MFNKLRQICNNCNNAQSNIWKFNIGAKHISRYICLIILMKIMYHRMHQRVPFVLHKICKYTFSLKVGNNNLYVIDFLINVDKGETKASYIHRLVRLLILSRRTVEIAKLAIAYTIVWVGHRPPLFSIRTMEQMFVS